MPKQNFISVQMFATRPVIPYISSDCKEAFVGYGMFFVVFVSEDDFNTN